MGADLPANERGSPVGCEGRWRPKSQGGPVPELDDWQADSMRRDGTGSVQSVGRIRTSVGGGSNNIMQLREVGARMR